MTEELMCVLEKCPVDAVKEKIRQSVSEKDNTVTVEYTPNSIKVTVVTVSGNKKRTKTFGGTWGTI